MKKELKDREVVKSCYTKVKSKQYGDLTSRYDSHICGTCKNYTYLSFLSCMVCKMNVCTSHITVCDCLNMSVILNIRFSEEVDISTNFLLIILEPQGVRSFGREGFSLS